MRVVVAHDGSSAAHVASDLAVVIDWPAGTVIRIVGAGNHQVQPDEAGLTPTSVLGAPQADLQATLDLEPVARSLRRPGVRTETAVLDGDAADSIIHDTVAFGADLLVTGSRRRGFVQSLLGMSATGEIVDRAPCPVLVARSASLRSIMLTTDGSAQSDAALELVARWPIFDLVRVYVVTVTSSASASGPRSPGRSAPIGEGELAARAAAARLMDAGREVMTDVLTGRPGPELVRAAAKRSVDLVVIGSRGRTGLGRTLLGSVTGEVLANVDCSVLIVGPPARRLR
jgi:nucleotide-binding universal stress UspA family protein